MSLKWLISFLCCWLLPSLIPTVVVCCEHQSIQELIRTSPVILKALGARIFADIVQDDMKTRGNNNATSIITLTPETLYKGASILKVAKTADSSEYFQYEGQLNATLEPLKCFDSSILDLLPTKIIIFGKLDTYRADVLRVSINGLHKWSPQFENHIWKYLGWDDWSDFTPCSVTCGKGVQQRFRRCLLDSPTNSDRANSDSDSIRSSLSSSGSSSSSTSSLNYRYIDSDQSSELVESRSRGERQHLEQLRNYHHRQHQQEYQYHNTRFDKNGRSNNRNHKKYMTSSKMKRKRKKKGKVLSTLSCEGYNIEQRNCNMFECRDDISDLLKFYKKPLTFNESMSQSLVSTTTTPEHSFLGSSSTGSTAQPATTNGYYPNRWKNSMNFTLMATLRAKSKAHLTIFSVRNFTHNMYLEQSLDGLKLFQERDDVTEMLPIKLDLYDNRWHQIAISVHNGDFITIHVDCLWTNSFVVSKGLFSLPDGADVEVGRNFNGDLLQLLLIPGNHDKLQCSTVRTSINEVKRYIIDTFIDDEDSN